MWRQPFICVGTLAGIGLVLAAFLTCDTHSRSLSKAEMTSLYGGGAIADRTCGRDENTCDHDLADERPCGAGDGYCLHVLGLYVESGNKLFCNVPAEGVPCDEDTPYVVCETVKHCEWDPEEHSCYPNYNEFPPETGPAGCHYES